MGFFDWSPPPNGGGYKLLPDTGLSNVPNLTAHRVRSRKLKTRVALERDLEPLYVTSLKVFPSRIKMQVRRDRIGEGHSIKSQTQPYSKRKNITEFSEKSRDNLKALAYDLGVLYAPDLMLTLTYPAEWKSVCTPPKFCICGWSDAQNQGCSDYLEPCTCPEPSVSGEVVKHHFSLMRKRITRYFRKRDIEVGCLWFLEFQKREAPHLHLILWGGRTRQLNITDMRLEFARAWSEIVNHSDENEREKHLRAGTSLDWMRKGHFGYAAKYASKMEQKEVPSYFKNVGRFWGLFGCSRPKPIETIDYLTRDELIAIKERLIVNLREVAPRFTERIIKFVNNRLDITDRFGFTFFGYAVGDVNMRSQDWMLAVPN